MLARQGEFIQESTRDCCDRPYAAPYLHPHPVRDLPIHSNRGRQRENVRRSPEGRRTGEDQLTVRERLSLKRPPCWSFHACSRSFQTTMNELATIYTSFSAAPPQQNAPASPNLDLPPLRPCPPAGRHSPRGLQSPTLPELWANLRQQAGRPRNALKPPEQPVNHLSY